uniref:Uncharacterized protein n=1 Tax=Cyprinus carpio TaxID=7962 RepID=A0A8C2CEX5_CYPCA
MNELEPECIKKSFCDSEDDPESVSLKFWLKRAVTHYHDLSCMVFHHSKSATNQIPTGPRQDVFTGALEVTLVAIKGVVLRITPCPACLVFRAACLFLWTMESTEIRNLIETPSGRVAILTTVCAGMHTVWDLGNTPAGTELH